MAWGNEEAMSNQGSRLSRKLQEFAKDIGSSAAAQAAASVTRLVNRDLAVMEINSGLLRVQTLMDQMAGPENEAVGIYSRVEGQAPGHAVMLFPAWEAGPLVDAMTHQPYGSTSDISEAAKSALSEMGNIIISSALTTFSNKTGLSFRPTPPEIVVDMAWAIVSSVAAFTFKIDERALMMAAHLSDERVSLDSLFLFIPDAGSLETMYHAYTRQLADTGLDVLANFVLPSINIQPTTDMPRPFAN